MSSNSNNYEEHGVQEKQTSLLVGLVSHRCRPHWENWTCFVSHRCRFSCEIRTIVIKSSASIIIKMDNNYSSQLLFFLIVSSVFNRIRISLVLGFFFSLELYIVTSFRFV